MMEPCEPSRSSSPPAPPTSGWSTSTSPSPGPHDVLVEVHSVGISFPDLLLSKGEYQLRPEPPFTLGVDVAGTVVSQVDAGRLDQRAGFAPGRAVRSCRTAARASAR